MKTYSILLFICLSVTLQAQSNFGIGINLFPHFASAMVTDPGGEEQDALAELQNLKTPQFAFAGGIAIYYFATEHIAINSGLNFMQSGYSTKEQELSWPVPDPSLAVRSKSRNDISYIGIPVLFNYYFRGSHTSGLFTTIGPEFSVPVKDISKITLIYADGSEETEKTDFTIDGARYQIPSIALDAGIGYQFILTDHLSLTAQPFVQYNLTGVYAESDLKVALLNSGLQLQLLLQ